MVLLFLVLYYVYPLKFVFTLLFHAVMGVEGINLGWHEASVLMRLYALGFASVFFLFVLLYRHAYRLRRELQLNPAEVEAPRFEIRENVVMTLIGLLSFMVALRSPEWAGWVYALIGPVLWIHGSIYGKRIRMLGEKIAAEKS